MSLHTTSSQTVGPYLHIGLTWLNTDEPASYPASTGDRRSRSTGRIIDGDGTPVSDALVEIWQANAQGRYAHPDDTRTSRSSPASRASAAFRPTPTGVSRSPRSSRARAGAGRGLAGAAHQRDDTSCAACCGTCVSRIYFADEACQRRGSGAAQRSRAAPRDADRHAGRGARRYARWNVVLQGDGETVFFEQ